MADLSNFDQRLPGDPRIPSLVPDGYHLTTRAGSAFNARWELVGYPCAQGAIAVLFLAGEIDISNVGMVAAAIVRAFDLHPAGLVIDLSAVRFCSVRGYDQICSARRWAEGAGIGFAVSRVPAGLRRVAAAVWGPGPTFSYETLRDALDALDRPGNVRPTYRGGAAD